MEKTIYASILDAYLDPDYAEADMGEAKHTGDELLDLTDGESPSDFAPSAHRAATLKASGISSHRNIESKTQTRAVTAVPDDWRGKAAKTIGDDNAITDAAMSFDKAEKVTYESNSLSEAELKNYIDDLLNLGLEPAKVAAKLEKLAELEVFNRSIGSQYLDSQAGLLGLAYLKPNAYMDNCPSTYERMEKHGGVRAKSVKKIQACEGCSSFVKAAHGAPARCQIYRLPIVANEKELFPIIQSITAGAKNTKETLVKIANRDDQRYTPKSASSDVTRVATPTHSKSIHDLGSKKEASFTREDVEALHKQGNSLETIYEKGMKTAGQVTASRAVKEFLNTLKRTNNKIALSKIDCSFLKNKLATHNVIVGDSRCASCSYRSEMHCGLTGGTLVSFPGMDKMASNHKIAAGAPKDGHQMLNDYDLTHKRAAEDIDISAPVRDEIEPGGKLNLD
jgi:hypothetical protein